MCVHVCVRTQYQIGHFVKKCPKESLVSRIDIGAKDSAPITTKAVHQIIILLI